MHWKVHRFLRKARPLTDLTWVWGSLVRGSRSGARVKCKTAEFLTKTQLHVGYSSKEVQMTKVLGKFYLGVSGICKWMKDKALTRSTSSGEF